MILRSRLLFAALTMAIFVSCTTTTATRVKPNDYTTKGIRYWLAAPYLLVKEPVEVARTEELFQYDAGANTLKPVNTPPIAKRTNGAGEALSGFAFAQNNSGGFGTGADDKKSSDDEGDDDDKDSKGKGSKGEDEDSTPVVPVQTGKVDIAWLPDYCHQYAIHQETILAKQTQKLTLGDGWRFVSFEATQDSTDIVSKVLELAGAVVGAKGGASESAEGGEGEGEGEGGEEAQAGKVLHLKKVTITFIPPGIYPLLGRKDNKCEELPIITPDSLKFETRTEWETMEVGN